MLATRLHAILASGCLAAALAGCDRTLTGEATNRPDKTLTGTSKPQPAKVVIPPGVVGTVAQEASLVGAEPMVVKGYGLVVGLGKAGSSGEAPASVRRYLVQQMLKQGLDSFAAGTERLTPAQMLKDRDTAIVVVGGQIPPAAPVGTRFDLYVETLPRSQTVSLDGGVLMTTELRLALTTAASAVGTAKSWAAGRGQVFVNPFIDRTKSEEQVKLRIGRIPGGGVVTRPRALRLELRRPDYRMVNLIGDRINQRFDRYGKVARPKTPSVIELRIPPEWRNEYHRFLELILHVYLLGGPAETDHHAKQLARAILEPMARHEDIALVWEAMGRQIRPIIQPLYTSTNPAAAFYAARTGLRLEDSLALEPMVRAAQHANSPYQIPAIEELGRARWSTRAATPLRRMLSDRSALVCVAAYAALRDHGPTSAISRMQLCKDFTVDVVDSGRHFMIYATRAGEPKIVLFGRNIPIRQPVFYCPADDLVTINAAAADKQLTVYRKIPRTGQMSEAFQVKPTAHELIRTLSAPPEMAVDGRIEGLGMTYSQVVGVLYGLCQAKHISADFVLQRSPAVQRIYTATSAVGRSDMPE